MAFDAREVRITFHVFTFDDYTIVRQPSANQREIASKSCVLKESVYNSDTLSDGGFAWNNKLLQLKKGGLKPQGKVIPCKDFSTKASR